MDNKRQNTERALTISEAAKYACVSRGTIESWLARGLLPYEELPGTGEGKGTQRFRRARRVDFDDFLDQNYCSSSGLQLSKVTNTKHKPIIFLVRSSLEKEQGLP